MLILDRDGYAAHNVKLNGGGVMARLAGENQLSGEFIFGHRGGTVDLYGHNLTLDGHHASGSGAILPITWAVPLQPSRSREVVYRIIWEPS